MKDIVVYGLHGLTLLFAVAGWWGWGVHQRPDNSVERELASGWAKILGPIFAVIAFIVAHAIGAQ